MGNGELSTRSTDARLLSPRKRRAFALLSIALGLVVAALILMVGELVVRVFTNVTFAGTSASLFTPNRFGASRGNRPSAEDVAFGGRVFTDPRGFRVPSLDYRYSPHARREVLVLGDSVAFGPGVREEETFVGRIRARHPETNVYNAACIGYSTRDYENVLHALLAQDSLHPSRVVLFFCLNDVSARSAVQLDWTQRFRHIGVTEKINAALRDRSKLYLWLRGVTTHPADRYFMADYHLYTDEEKVHAALLPIARMADDLRRRDTAFTVVICPNEPQLKRGTAGDPFLPQKRVRAFLASRGIQHVDAAGPFLAAAALRPPEDFYLPFDAMHFSSAGHELMARIAEPYLVR